MSGLIAAEFKRLLRNKSTLVCMIIAAVLGIAVALLYRYFWIERGNNIAISYQLMELYGLDTNVLDEAFSVVPKLDIWSFISAFLSDEFKWILSSINCASSDKCARILSSICVCSLMTSEFSSGTIKNTVSRGFSRTAIYISKLITAVIQVFAVTICYVGAGAVTALFFVRDSVSAKPQDIILCIVTNILLLIATAAVFVMLCVIFRRSGMSVAAAIAAPFLLVSLLGILSMALPDGSPLYSRFVLMETFATVERYIRAGEGWVALVTGGAYLLISSVTGIIIFRKCDIK